MSQLTVEPALPDVPISKPIPRLSRPAFLIRYRFAILFFITLLGAVLRFSFMDKPPLWGDEAFTYSRVCGDYRQMLDVLAYDGFPPLHYEAYWVLRQWKPLTPRMMRMIPSVAGTLMIPAMYFLAVQMVRKRTALLVALFTSVSAYMMVYSHDAKMYMQSWLFIVLNVACLLWWLRTGLRVAWLAWIATGLAMAGFHLSSLAVLAVEVLILLTNHLRWRSAVLFIAGVAVIAAGPLGYQLGFNRWSEQIDEKGFASGSGVGWVESYNRERTGPDLALYAATAHLYSWEWPSHPNQIAKPPIDPDVMHGLMIAGVALLALMAVGLFNFRGALVVSAKEPGKKWWHGRLARTLFERKRGRDAHATDQFPSAQSDPANNQHSSWRAALWLGAWIIVPAYGLYCHSMREFASPIEWFERIGDLIDQHWIMLGIEVFLFIVISQFWKVFPRYLVAAILVAACLFLIHVVLNFCTAQQHHTAHWKTAYWPILSQWWNGISNPQVLAAIAGVLPVIAWHFSGNSLKERSKRTGHMLLVTIAILVACGGVYRYTVYHFDQLTAKAMIDHHDAPQWEMFAQYAVKDHGVPEREATLKKLRVEFTNLSNEMIERRADRLIESRKIRWNKLLAAKQKREPTLTEEKAIRAVAERLGSEKVVWDKWVSVWMPRYVGMVWPAVAIAACALLLRLPTWPLRYAAVGLLLAVNFGQSTARLFAGSEPPLDRVYADLTASQENIHGKPTGTTTRTYLSQMSQFTLPHPGSISVFAMTGRYYLSLAAKVPIQPEEFRSFSSSPKSGEAWEPWKFKFNIDEPPKSIVANLQKSTGITRVIFWEKLEKLPPEGTSGSEVKLSKGTSNSVAPLLGPEWKLFDEKIFHGRVHWTWQDLYVVRRREYVKQTMPATQPK